jgi:hypothetical protein
LYVSRIVRGERIYDERNFRELLNVQRVRRRVMKRSYLERDWSAEPCGSVVPEATIAVIPRSEWADRIEMLEKTGNLLGELMPALGVPIQYQASTNYCWNFGVVDAVHGVNARAGRPHVDLSPASVACLVKGYRNVGGWGIEAVRGINKHGIASTKHWPAAAIHKKYDNAASRADRKNRTIPEFLELRPRDFAVVMTCLLNGWPVPAGLLWWRHLVNFVDPVVLGRDEFGVRARNSWGPEWNGDGTIILTEAKATPDEATTIQTFHAVAA